MDFLASGMAWSRTVQEPDHRPQQKGSGGVVRDGIWQGQKQPDIENAERHLRHQQRAEQSSSPPRPAPGQEGQGDGSEHEEGDQGADAVQVGKSGQAKAE